MSEYVTVEIEATGDPNVRRLITNQTLVEDGEEVYLSPAEGDEGSPVAQMLFNGVEGIAALRISGGALTITRDPDAPWEAILDEVRDALRDFFL